MYQHIKDVKEHMNAPGSLFELLIFDNLKLAAEKDGPHMILRRARPGEEISSPFLDDAEDSAEQEVESKEEGTLPDEQANSISLDEEHEVQDLDMPGESENKTEDPVDEGEKVESFVSLKTISTYIDSLSHHVPSEVERVVDAIVSLEPKKEKEMPLDPEQPKKSDGEQPDVEQLTEERPDPVLEVDQRKMQEQKKSIDLSEIFRSLKRVRKKATQKSASYTKKVEYEDQ